MTGRLVLLSTSHRVATGLLTRDAWQTLERADRIFAAAEHPLAAILSDARLTVSAAQEQAPADQARELLAGAAEHTVVWLLADDADTSLTEALAVQLARLAEQADPPEVELMIGSFDVPGARLLDLVAVMDRLRSPGGCPWDAEQTHLTLAPYLLEETYETLHAIDVGNLEELREELGDLLLQVAFHARVAEENPDRPWSIDDVAAGIVEKLVHRHPHVFADVTADSPAQVEANWHQLKVAEKGRTSAVDGVPMAQPALSLASKLIARAVQAGIPVEIEEPELPAELSTEELGLILLGVVSSARRRGLDPEGALRAAAMSLVDQIRAMESTP